MTKYAIGVKAKLAVGFAALLMATVLTSELVSAGDPREDFEKPLVAHQDRLLCSSILQRCEDLLEKKIAAYLALELFRI
jgi:hypothetical protein